MSDLVSQNVNMIFESLKGEAVHALKDISFTLKKGELLTVLGPSGCGKTTLLNIAAGFLRPTSGIITLGNKEINGPGVERGMVFQQGALFEWLTVAENVNFGLRMKKEDSVTTAKKVEEWLEIVGLQGFGNTPTYQLSGGMQQRVALARCLINDPDLILMDEPLGALDALTREKMQSLVLRIWKETGKTIILITHSVEEALLLGERSYVMAPRPGRIHKEYKLPFASMGLKEDLREIKNNKEFVFKREEILSMIWDMEEEIMGKEFRMITGTITFLIIFAVIGSILYGQRQIKSEKSDAVFGNPERAKGGIHWVVVGTCFLLFTWLYYSWDIAKAFYPKSANELCQVAKVNESLLSLKYLFPIEERSHKSTALIKRENINISDKIIEIQNSSDLKNQDKVIFVNLLNKTRQTIPLLTNKNYLETETKNTINELTNRINELKENFPKDSFPPRLSDEEENKRIEAVKNN